mmetsp:Transcript_36673/g.103465  ORF Transcript_36673/g.103465 Transcript_36673/m.103465 type:complete len:253 (+) Transcript_36673:70-828(+)
MAYTSSIATAPSKKALAAVPGNAVENMCFKPSSASFCRHSQYPKVARGENFMETHEIGKRDTKYYRMKLSKQLLPTREDCHSTRQFRGMAPADLAFNTEVYRSLLSAKDRKPSAGSLSGVPTSKAHFPAHARVETQSMKTEVESDTRHITGGPGAWATASSHTHEQHGPVRNAWPAARFGSHGTLELPADTGAYKTTQYHRDFNLSERSRPGGQHHEIDALLAGMRATPHKKGMQRNRTAPGGVAFIGSREK